MRFPKLREYIESLPSNTRRFSHEKKKSLNYLSFLEDIPNNLWEVHANFEMRWGRYGTEWRIVGKSETFCFDKVDIETPWFGDGQDKEAVALVHFLNDIPALHAELCSFKERFLRDGFGDMETAFGYGIGLDFIPRFTSRAGIEGVVRIMEKLGYERCGCIPIIFSKPTVGERFK